MVKKSPATKATSPSAIASGEPGFGVPRELYTHADPLLRRLRLVDSHGAGVNLEREFRDAQVVGFLFGQAWNGAMDKSEALYTLAHEFARIHPHQFKCVYVEAGVGREDYRRATDGKLWLSMEFDDGSGQSEEEEGNPLQLARNEDFLLPCDDIVTPLDDNVTKDSSYLPPISRAYLTDYRNVLSAPNLQIYHLPTRKWLTGGMGVRHQLLVKGRRIDTWEKWELGQSVDLRLKDYLVALRWTIALFVLAMGYLLALQQDPSINLVHLGEKLHNLHSSA